MQIDYEDREGKYIRTRVILLGETASQVKISELLNDVSVYSVTQKNEVNVSNIEQYIGDADIVLLLANGDDASALEHIHTVIKILNRNEVLYVRIIANAKAFSASKTKVGDIQTSSLLIVENQENLSIKVEVSTLKKMETVLDALCQLIDNEINTYRVHENDCSALITLESFFIDKGDLHLYTFNTYNEFKDTLKNDLELRLHLEKALGVWLKFSSVEKSSQEIVNFIELIEENLDENADVYYYTHKGNNIMFLLYSIN